MAHPGGRTLAAGLFLITVAACGLQPTPTPLAPAAATRVEVAYENHSGDEYIVSILGAAPDQQGFATIDPCSTSAVSIAAEPPFEIGFGQGIELAPQPVIATSDDFDGPVDGQYRYFIRIAADGTVESGVLIGPPEFGVGAVC